MRFYVLAALLLLPACGWQKPLARSAPLEADTYVCACKAVVPWADGEGFHGAYADTGAWAWCMEQRGWRKEREP
jgi:hypothetical protein